MVTRAEATGQLSEAHYGIAIVNADAAAASAFPDADVESDNVRWLVRGMHVNIMTDLSDRAQFVASPRTPPGNRLLYFANRVPGQVS